MSILKKKINTALRLLQPFWEYLLAHNLIRKFSSKRIIIVRLDHIGDYILWRNFLKDLKDSKKFKNYHITLCGNNLWKDLAELLDYQFVDKFIWIDKYRFFHETNVAYKFKTLLKINWIKYDYLLHPTFSRDENSDNFVNLINAKIKIGQEGDLENESIKIKEVTDKYYDRLITYNNVNFEFERNRLFFSSIIEENLDKTNLFIPWEHTKKDHKHCVIFPGASFYKKSWPAERFSELCKYVHNELGFEIYLLGSTSEKELINGIIEMSGANALPIINFPQSDILDYIVTASFIIANDSAGFHFGMCLHVPTICISNGHRYGRFVPYPDYYQNIVRYIFPESFLQDNLTNKNDNVNYTVDYCYNVNEISIETVKENVREITS